MKAGEEGDRGWDSWIASPTWWTWASASSGSWWWTGKSGMLQSVGSQRVGHDWATELKNFPQVVVIHKVFSIINETDVFLEFSCFFYDPVNVGNLISGSSAFSKSSLNIWISPLNQPLFIVHDSIIWLSSAKGLQQCALIWMISVVTIWHWNNVLMC